MKKSNLFVLTLGALALTACTSPLRKKKRTRIGDTPDTNRQNIGLNFHPNSVFVAKVKPNTNRYQAYD